MQRMLFYLSPSVPNLFNLKSNELVNVSDIVYSATGQARVEDVLLHAARPSAVPTQGRAWVPQVTTERQPT